MGTAVAEAEVGANVGGEVAGAVEPDEDELHPAAMTEQTRRASRVPRTAQCLRGKCKGSAESLME